MLKLKRLFDLFLSGIGLIILSPVLVLLAILVEIDSPGPIFSRRDRVGSNRRSKDRRLFNLDRPADRRDYRCRRRENYFGEPITVYKFRTLHKDAERNSESIWITLDDPRVTRLGWLMRKTGLDELPQLWNVFKGDMSLVAPGPEIRYFIG